MKFSVVFGEGIGKKFEGWPCIEKFRSSNDNCDSAV